ncbi:hypothetical protein T484DRAFT_1795662, partial [Baffinella frigidus]
MWSPTSTQAFQYNVPGARSSWPSRAGAPSPSISASSPPAAGNPSPSSVKTPAKLPSLVQRRRSTIDATKHQYPFADLNEEDSIITELSMASTPITPTAQRNTNTTSKIRRARSNSVVVSNCGTTTTAPFATIASPTAAYTYVEPFAPIASPAAAYTYDDVSDDDVVTDANFKVHRHRHGGCLAHPSGCDCEKVQRPTMGQNEAWQVMSLRFKAVHAPTAWHQPPALLTPISAGANAPLERRESDPLPRRVNGATLLAPVSTGANAPLKRRESGPAPLRATAPRVEDLREREPRGGKSIEKVLSRLPARSTGPAVLAVPSHVAQRLKPVGHDSRAGAA